MRFALTLLIFATGLAASLALTTAHAASVALADLPGLGYVLSLRFDTQRQCGEYWVVSGNGAPETLIGDPQHGYCQIPGAIEARIAALLALYPPVSATDAVPVTVTVTTAATTTEFVTTTAPAVTVTSLETSTVTVPTTETQTVVQVATVERTLTQTVAAPVVVPVVAPQGVTVDDASAQAYVSSLASGWDESFAALAARSAGANVEYGLALA